LFRGGVFAIAAAAAAAARVISTNWASSLLSPHVSNATKISAFYVAHKIVLAA